MPERCPGVAELRAPFSCLFSRFDASERRTPNVQRPISNREPAGGGARTHTALRPLDFESSASANSATPALEDVKLQGSPRSSSASDEIERLQTSRRPGPLTGISGHINSQSRWKSWQGHC